MSSEAVALIGFVSLFVLMPLRVPVGMAMGLVGITGFGYLTGLAPALKLVGQTTMRTVTDYSFGVIPMFLLMGAFVSVSGISRELFRAANTFVGHWKGGLGIATIARLRRLCRNLGLLGRDRRDVFRRRLSGDAPLRLSAILRHRRDRGRRHAWARCCRRPPCSRSTASSPSRISENCSSPAWCRACSRSSMHMLTIGIIGLVRPKFLPAGPARDVARAPAGAARRLVAAIAVPVRDRRALWRLLHPDRGGRASAPSAPSSSACSAAN